MTTSPDEFGRLELAAVEARQVERRRGVPDEMARAARRHEDRHRHVIARTTASTATIAPPLRARSSGSRCFTHSPLVGARCEPGYPARSARLRELARPSGRSGRRFALGVSATSVPRAITPPPIQSQSIIGLTATPIVTRPRWLGDEMSVR